MTAMTLTTEIKELDARSGDGLEVRLLWHPETDTITVSVVDLTHGHAFELAVDPGDAVDAFQHPFAYASFRGIPYDAPLRQPEEHAVAA